VTNRFDVVAIRIENESAIVVRMIVRTKPGRAVVDAAGCKRRPVKFVDDFPAFGREGYMCTCLRCITLTDPEESLLSNAVTCKSFAFSIKTLYANRAEYGVIKIFDRSRSRTPIVT